MLIGFPQMIKAGLPVFFGSDVGQSSDRISGVMDTNLMEYEVHAPPFLLQYTDLPLYCTW